MQNITRTLTKYEIKAINIGEDANGDAMLKTYASCEVTATGMSKGAARSALADATGETMPKGITIVWKPLSTVQYVMPLDEFLKSATVVSAE